MCNMHVYGLVFIGIEEKDKSKILKNLRYIRFVLILRCKITQKF